MSATTSYLSKIFLSNEYICLFEHSPNYLFYEHHKKELQELLDKNFDMLLKNRYYPRWEPLTAALYLKDEEKIRQFLFAYTKLETSSDIFDGLRQIPITEQTSFGETIWHYLALSGNYQILAKAAKYNPAVANIKNMYGETIWHFLAKSGNYQALKQAIIDNPEVANVQNTYDDTIWHLLAKSGNYKALKQAIIDNPEVANVKNEVGASIWHYLAKSGNYEALKQAVIDNPAIASIKNDYGSTIWHYLARSSNSQALSQALIDNPETANIRNNNFKSVWDNLHTSDYKKAERLEEIWSKLCFGSMSSFVNTFPCNLELSFTYLFSQYNLAKNQKNRYSQIMILAGLKIIVEEIFTLKNKQPVYSVILYGMLKYKETVLSILLDLSPKKMQVALSKFYKSGIPKTVYFMAPLTIHLKNMMLGEKAKTWCLENLSYISFILKNMQHSGMPNYREFFKGYNIPIVTKAETGTADSRGADVPLAASVRRGPKTYLG